jgi:hypothetical protein
MLGKKHWPKQLGTNDALNGFDRKVGQQAIRIAYVCRRRDNMVDRSKPPHHGFDLNLLGNIAWDNPDLGPAADLRGRICKPVGISTGEHHRAALPGNPLRQGETHSRSSTGNQRGCRYKIQQFQSPSVRKLDWPDVRGKREDAILIIGLTDRGNLRRVPARIDGRGIPGSRQSSAGWQALRNGIDRWSFAALQQPSAKAPSCDQAEGEPKQALG